ncbi:MAG: TetR family transcriptional regulator C-terminal domain-containing protein [Clostridia bacterium]|nr:TetR family transcriptional regulator C-terminal domain-containing protein [Clostridia bacterium]MDD7698191.1 TetR-like C-terminal domain-containing protein [Spirochaetia bacterium]
MAQAIEAPQKKEDRRVRRTKKLLTQALTQLLQEKQINEITVKELTDLADMNRGTFYLYYKDMFDMLEKIEDGMFEALDAIISLHEHDDVSQQTKPILLDLFDFIEENQEMCRVLLSPHGDMNFLHRLNEVVREKCLKAWPDIRKEKGEADFDYHYSFVVFGCAGIIRAWVNRNCPESAEKMAEMAYGMILRGSLSGV